MRKFVTKAVAGIMALAVAVSSVVAVNPTTASAKVKVKRVKVTAPSGKTAYVAKGKRVKLATTVTVTPSKKANKKVAYKSANSKIATVNAKGVIRGKNAGKTKITVTSRKDAKKKTTIKVVVKKAAVKKVKLNTSNFVLSAGDKKTLKATVTPKKNTCTKVEWSSSKKSVATVSSQGVVKGIKNGTTTITAKACDGSGKKASVKVTVGIGIASVSVLNNNLVRVTLTGKKALKASNFDVQTKAGPTSTKYTKKIVQSAITIDQKVYDVNLERAVYVGDYLKVTISALASNKSAEIYVEKASGYGNAGNETVEWVTGNKDTMGMYSDWWIISNSNKVGDITYTGVSGLPSGLKAYISQDRTSVRVRGRINDIHRGTTAVLTGTDEKGKVFKKRYIFVIGSNDTMVAVAKPADTYLTYRPDDPKTVKNEASGYEIDAYDICGRVQVGGGSDDYSFKVTYNGKDLDEFIYDSNHERVETKAGTYDFTVTFTDDHDENIKTSANVTLILQDGVTVSGSVRDAAGQPVREIHIYGYTKEDAYGRQNGMYAVSETDGTYSTRVLPGEYYTYCDGGYDTTYDTTAGNIFNKNTIKNFTIPLYKVTFSTNIPGAVGYSGSDIEVMDTYGNSTWVETYSNSYDRDRSMYAYLKPGSYEVMSYEAYPYYNTVNAYSKLEEYTDSVTGIKRYYLTDLLGQYKVSGTFTVNGNNRVVLNATKYADSDY